MWDLDAVMFVPVDGSIRTSLPGGDARTRLLLTLPYEHHNSHPQWRLRILDSDAEIASIPKCPLHSRYSIDLFVRQAIYYSGRPQHIGPEYGA